MNRFYQFLLGIVLVMIFLTREKIPLFAKNASWLGSSIVDLILVLIGLFILNEWHFDIKKKRREAAIHLHAIIKAYCYYIEQIKDRYGLYEHKDFYPDRIPEFAIKEHEEQHKERPARLIYNSTQELRKQVDMFPNIGKEEYGKLQKYFESINKASGTLANILYEQNRNSYSTNNVLIPHVDSCIITIQKESDEILEWLMSIIAEKHPLETMQEYINNLILRNNVTKAIWKNYGIGFLGTLLLTIFMRYVSTQLIAFLPEYTEDIKYWSKILAILSTATTLYGKAGWEIQTWDGKSDLERIDRAVFNALYILSYSFTMLTIFVK